MTIQRTAYSIEKIKDDDGAQSVVLTVQCTGQLETRADVLLMFADAWSDAMINEGFDPVKSMASMQIQGTMQ